MEMTAMRPVEFATQEEERMALRSTGSLKKRDFSAFSDKVDEISSEECECGKRRKVGVAKLQDTLLSSLKSLVSESCRLEGWKALYCATTERCSVSQSDKSKAAASKWARAGTMAAKVGKGLCKDNKGQKLALRHWLELIDTHHRYGHNLHFYYDVWIRSHSSQPFFYWLDIGDGKEVNLEKCPRTELQSQCIRYLKPEEREAYEVSIESGRLIYRQSKSVVHTPEGSKWIFVLSTSRTFYIGEKKKGLFHHSSFLAGGATISSGRLVAFNGVLHAIWPYSGHYCPTEKNFMEFIAFLQQHKVDLTNVQKYAVDDDVPPSEPVEEEQQCDCTESNIMDEASEVREKKQLSIKWTSRSDPRVDCVGQYPTKLQFRTLEHLNLSPRVLGVTLGKLARNTYISSPRLTSKFHLSPRVLHTNLHVTPAN